MCLKAKMTSVLLYWIFYYKPICCVHCYCCQAAKLGWPRLWSFKAILTECQNHGFNSFFFNLLLGPKRLQRLLMFFFIKIGNYKLFCTNQVIKLYTSKFLATFISLQWVENQGYFENSFRLLNNKFRGSSPSARYASLLFDQWVP